MADQTAISIEKHLAINVMGFTLERPDKHPSNPSSYCNKGKFVCLDYLWDPKNNIEQAFMCLDIFRKKGKVELYSDPAGYSATFTPSKGNFYSGGCIDYNQLAGVLSLMLAKATGWEDSK